MERLRGKFGEQKTRRSREGERQCDYERDGKEGLVANRREQGGRKDREREEKISRKKL